MNFRISKAALVALVLLAPGFASAANFANGTFNNITGNSLTVGGSTISLGGNLTTNGALTFKGAGTFTLPAPGALLNSSALPSASASQIYGGTGSAGAATPLSNLPAAIQSGITQVGTLTAGTWNGTSVGVAYGGTGASTPSAALANLGGLSAATAASTYAPLASPALTGTPTLNGNPLTVGGAFTTSGAYPLTFTQSGATNITWPSGTNTIAGMAFQAPGSVAITGGTWNGGTIGATAQVNSINTYSLTANNSTSWNVGSSQYGFESNGYSNGTAPSGISQTAWFGSSDGVTVNTGSTFNRVTITDNLPNPTGTGGSHTGLEINEIENASTTSWPGGIAPLQLYMYSNSKEGGTLGTPSSSSWGTDIYNALGGSSGAAAGVYGVEIDTSVLSGANSAAKNALVIVEETNDATRGFAEDAAISIGNQNGALSSWKNGLEFGSVRNGAWPFASDSSIISINDKQYSYAPTFTDMPANIGIDFRAGYFTTAAYLSNGAGIDPAGNISGGNFIANGSVQDETDTLSSITINNGGVYTVIPSILVQSPAVSGTTATGTVTSMVASSIVPEISFGNPGTGYVTGDVVAATGGTGTEPTYTVTATGGVVTALTETTPGNLTVLPSEPVSMSGGTGTGLTANLGFAVGSIRTTAGSNYTPGVLPVVYATSVAGLNRPAVLTPVMSAPTYGNLVLNPNGGAVVLGKPYTVSTLPICNSGAAGETAYVTDATSPSYNAALSGSGTVKTLAFCNGSSWTAH